MTGCNSLPQAMRQSSSVLDRLKLLACNWSKPLVTSPVQLDIKSVYIYDRILIRRVFKLIVGYVMLIVNVM